MPERGAGRRKRKRMKRKREGEAEFERLLSAHKDTIYTVCFMFSRDSDEVSDLFQEVAINLWQGFAGFEGRSDERTWVYRVALNTCLSAGRKKKRRPTVPLTMDIDLYEDTDAESRQVQQLYSRISRLEPFDRAIVLLWLENMSYEDIGAMVGISAKNVSVRLVRIREKLKNMNENPQ